MQPVLFQCPDILPAGKYLPGSYHWAQAVQITGAALTCQPPKAGLLTLSLEVNGALLAPPVQFGVSPTSGPVKQRVVCRVAVAPGQTVRWLADFTGQPEEAAMQVAVTMDVTPATIGSRQLTVTSLFVQYVYGRNTLRAFDYDPVTRAFTPTRAANGQLLTANLAEVQQTDRSVTFYLAKPGDKLEACLRVLNGNFTAPNFIAVGGVATGSTPKLQFCRTVNGGPAQVLATLTATELRVSDLQQGDSISAPPSDDPGFEFWSGAPPVLTAAIGSNGLVLTQGADMFDAILDALDFGVVADGVTDDTEAAQNAILAAFDRGRPIMFPPGEILVKHPICIPWFTRVIGAGPSMDWPGKSTRFIADPTFNVTWNSNGAPAAILQSNTYAPDPTGAARWRYEEGAFWNSAVLEHLSVDAQGHANLNGLAIHNMGENAQVNDMSIFRCGKSGILYTGIATPGSFRDISIWNCGDGAVKFTAHQEFSRPESGHIAKFYGISGDANSPAFFYFSGIGGNCVEISGFKYEHPNAQTEPAVLFDTDLTLGSATAETCMRLQGNMDAFIITGPDTGLSATDAIIINKPGSDPTRWPKVKIVLHAAISLHTNRIRDRTYNSGAGRVIPAASYTTGELVYSNVVEAFAAYSPSASQTV